MLLLSGADEPWLRRLDHVICEVPDIEVAVAEFVGLGFPPAWPVGRFWPTGRTAGVAIGGVNLEFVQPDEGAPTQATIRTLVFEPVDLAMAVRAFEAQGLEMRIVEKWESDPDLLVARGFSETDSRSPQLICRNAYPTVDIPIDFFICEYSPSLKQRLSTAAFPSIPYVARVVIGTPQPWEDWHRINCLFGVPKRKGPAEICIREEPTERPEVVEIVSDRGPIELSKLPARFRFA